MNYSLVDTMAKNSKTALDTLNDFKAEILIETLAETLAEHETKTIATRQEMWRPRPWMTRGLTWSKSRRPRHLATSKVM